MDYQEWMIGATGADGVQVRNSERGEGVALVLLYRPAKIERKANE